MDNDIWISMAISVILTTIKATVKNPARKTELKRAMLKVRDAINMLYADDPDFQS